MPCRFHALAALLLVAGCQPQRDDGDAARAPASPKVPAMPADGTMSAAPRPANKAVLDAGGVTFDFVSGKSQQFAFGALRSKVDALGEEMFGSAPERTEIAECGAGPMEFSRYGPLTLNFQDGKLAGWFARESAQVVTSDGIQPGKRMRDLKVARSARMIAGSTLEGEFEYLAADGHTIGGFAKGKGRDAVIDSLYAGMTCFFR